MRRRAADLNNAMTTRVLMRHSGTVAVEVKPAIELRPATLGIVQRHAEKLRSLNGAMADDTNLGAGI